MLKISDRERLRAKLGLTAGEPWGEERQLGPKLEILGWGGVLAPAEIPTLFHKYLCSGLGDMCFWLGQISLSWAPSSQPNLHPQVQREPQIGQSQALQPSNHSQVLQALPLLQA